MIAINRYTLGNGLRIVHHHDPTTKIVAVNLLYDVGSKDDETGRTGCAHLLEHLMFEGSENVPNFDTCLQDIGGDNNAFTSSDITNYYDILPAQNIETAFWLESDRMAGLRLTKEAVSVQKRVVIEEFKQRTLNRPYGDASALYRRVAYRRHPYRNLVIGSRIADIENIDLEYVRSYYGKYYSPDNAILSVVGNVEFDNCVKLAEKWFGPIPPSGIVRRSLKPEYKQLRSRTVSVEREVPSSAIYKAYHVCGRGDAKFPSFDIISDILANGKSSKLYHNLVVKKRIFSTINAVVTGDIEPGLLVISGRINRNISMQEAEEYICREVASLSDGRTLNKEINKVVNKYESSELFENIGAADLASRIAYYELLGDANDINKQIDMYRKFKTEDIVSSLRRSINPKNCTTLYYNAVNENNKRD